MGFEFQFQAQKKRGKEEIERGALSSKEQGVGSGEGCCQVSQVGVKDGAGRGRLGCGGGALCIHLFPVAHVYGRLPRPAATHVYPLSPHPLENHGHLADTHLRLLLNEGRNDMCSRRPAQHLSCWKTVGLSLAWLWYWACAQAVKSRKPKAALAVRCVLMRIMPLPGAPASMALLFKELLCKSRAIGSGRPFLKMKQRMARSVYSNKVSFRTAFIINVFAPDAAGLSLSWVFLATVSKVAVEELCSPCCRLLRKLFSEKHF